jgi:hypothetical protein
MRIHGESLEDVAVIEKIKFNNDKKIPWKVNKNNN